MNKPPRLPVVLAALTVLATTPALAAEGDWEVVLTQPIVVKTRPKPGTSVKEIWAEGPLDASVQDIQTTLMDADRFRFFMPHVKESRKILKPDPDGGEYVYVRLELPMVRSRDYVVKTYLEKSVAQDGNGDFANRWVAMPDRIPSRANSIRLRVNEGSWKVTPQPDGKSYAVYKFCVDPGGWVPAFAVDLGNKKGILDTFQAVEREAQRRAIERRKSELTKAAAQQTATPPADNTDSGTHATP